jgi:hypothetical protein
MLRFTVSAVMALEPSLMSSKIPPPLASGVTLNTPVPVMSIAVGSPEPPTVNLPAMHRPASERKTTEARTTEGSVIDLTKNVT